MAALPLLHEVRIAVFGLWRIGGGWLGRRCSGPARAGSGGVARAGWWAGEGAEAGGGGFGFFGGLGMALQADLHVNVAGVFLDRVIADPVLRLVHHAVAGIDGDVGRDALFLGHADALAADMFGLAGGAGLPRIVGHVQAAHGEHRYEYHPQLHRYTSGGVGGGAGLRDGV